jgi:hypothetical protein
MASISRARTPNLPAYRPAAGHAAHFLSRLDRIQDREVEYAISLYNRPEVIKAALARARLPERAERAAISIDHPLEGPFLVVTREARFVTCLGRGMRTGGLPIVTRPQLDLAWRELALLAQAEEFDSKPRLFRAQFKALLDAGGSATREQFEAVARWVPIFGPHLAAMLVDETRAQSELAIRARNIFAPHRRHEKLLRAIHECGHVLGHLNAMVGASEESGARMAKVRDAGGTPFAVSSMMFMSSPRPAWIRALWANSRWGVPLVDDIDEILSRLDTDLTLSDAMVSFGAIGVRDRDLRRAARTGLRDATSHVIPELRTFAKEQWQSLRRAFDEPETIDAVVVQAGRELYADLAVDGPDTVPAAEIPDDVARAMAMHIPVERDQLMSLGVLLLPWLARAEARDLYLPEKYARAVHKRWEMEDTLLDLALLRNPDGEVPRVRAVTQGRNERCACGSGKKFKRCCLRAVA